MTVGLLQRGGGLIDTHRFPCAGSVLLSGFNVVPILNFVPNMLWCNTFISVYLNAIE